MTSRTNVRIIVNVLFKKGGENTLTDKVITIEEARFALRMMEKCSLDSEEAIESIDGYIERMRNLSLAKLTDRIIETKLSDVQQCAVRDYWFNGISPAQTAQKLGISLSAVYSSRSKAQDIIKNYLEPLMMYFNDITAKDTAPVTEKYLQILKAQKSSADNLPEALKNLRIGKAVEPQTLSDMLNISIDELMKIEQGKAKITTETITKYCNIFNIDISIQCRNGEWRIKWTDR